jgi:hypothetical protein
MILESAAIYVADHLIEMNLKFTSMTRISETRIKADMQ